MYQINSGAEGLSLEEATHSNSYIFFTFRDLEVYCFLN